MKSKILKTYLKIYKMGLAKALLFCIPVWLIMAAVLVENFYIPYSNPDIGNRSIQEMSFTEHIRVMNYYLYRNFYVPLMGEEREDKISDKGRVQKFEIKINPESYRELIEDLPRSGKEKFFPASVIIEGDSFECEVKLRGASYWHWKLPHKSWRIRLLGGRRYKGLREFDIVRVKQSIPFIEPLTLELANEVGLLGAKSEPALLYVNGKISGFSYLLQNTKEDFILDKNLSDGSIYGLEREIKHLSPWKNSKSWLEIYGQFSEGDGKLFNEFLEKIDSTDLLDLYKFSINKLNLKIFNKYFAFDSVLGIIHHDKTNALRLFVSDETSSIMPIPWDHVLWANVNDFEASRNPMSDKWNLIPQFRHQVQKQAVKMLEGVLSEKHLLETFNDYYEKTKSSIACDQLRSHTLNPWERCYLPIHFRSIFPYSMVELGKLVDFYEFEIKSRNKFLNQYFQQSKLSGKLEWDGSKNILQLFSDGNVAQEIVEIQSSNTRATLIKDSNLNGFLDNEDVTVSLRSLVGELFYPGLKDPKKEEFSFASRGIRKKVPLKYTFFIKGKKIKSIDIKYKNSVLANETKTVILRSSPSIQNLTQKEVDSIHPWLVDKERKASQNPKKIILGPGEVTFAHTKFYDKDQSVSIKAGTTIKLGEDVSLVFKGGFFAQGQERSPIIFKPLKKGQMGRVTILGKESNGSYCYHCIFDSRQPMEVGASRIKNLFLLDNVDNVSLRSLKIWGSEAYKGALSIVHSNNISISGLQIKSAKGYGVHIKGANVKVEDSLVERSMGVGIRVVKSQVKLLRTKIEWGSDAPIELREGSSLFIKDVGIRSNITKIDVDANSEVIRR